MLGSVYALRGLHGLPPIGEQEAVAITMLFGGAVTVTGLTLYGTGHVKEAGLLAIAATVVGTIVGAARYYAEASK